MFVHELAKIVSPWNSLYADSKTVATGVTAVHILALLFGGGLALAADRTTLRALKRPVSERITQLRELRAVHRPVVIALVLLFVSGMAMALADVNTFATSAYFWVKMGLVTLLMANGFYLLVVERRLNAAVERAGPPEPVVEPALWRHLRRASFASLTLWGLTALAGALLTGMA